MPRLHQRYHRRPQAEFTLTRLWARSRRQNKCRTRPIDELPSLRRGKEERRIHISNASLTSSWLRCIRLPHKRPDDPSDQCDLIAEFYGNYWLNIEDIPSSVVRSDAKIAVVLQRNTDQAGHRVLSRLWLTRLSRWQPVVRQWQAPWPLGQPEYPAGRLRASTSLSPTTHLTAMDKLAQT